MCNALYLHIISLCTWEHGKKLGFVFNVEQNLLRRWKCCYVIKNEHIINSFDDLSARLTPKCLQPMSIWTMFLDAFVGVEHVLGISFLAIIAALLPATNIYSYSFSSRHRHTFNQQNNKFWFTYFGKLLCTRF